MARKYSFDKYGEGRSTIITLKDSFHGRTITTLNATGQDMFHQYFFPFTEGFKYVKANDFSELAMTADDTVCAVMMELVQGEGGVNVLDKEYVKTVAEYCKKNDWLLLIDEVQTGVGRTGTGRFSGLREGPRSPRPRHPWFHLRWQPHRRQRGSGSPLGAR